MGGRSRRLVETGRGVAQRASSRDVPRGVWWVRAARCAKLLGLGLQKRSRRLQPTSPGGQSQLWPRARVRLPVLELVCEGLRGVRRRQQRRRCSGEQHQGHGSHPSPRQWDQRPGALAGHHQQLLSRGLLMRGGQHRHGRSGWPGPGARLWGLRAQGRVRVLQAMGAGLRGAGSC